MKLQDRVAIVTGSAQGIGRAIADKLAAEGRQGRRRGHRRRGRRGSRGAQIPGAIAVTVDVSDPAQVASLVEQTVAAFGTLDILVNNAAIVPFTAWDDIDFAEWRRIMAVNLDGMFLTCRAASDEMRKHGYGRIVNIASNVDRRGHAEPGPLRGLQGRRLRASPGRSPPSWASTASRSTPWRPA